jgi:hypothetical protein
MTALSAGMRRAFAQAVVDAARARGELGSVPFPEALERAARGAEAAHAAGFLGRSLAERFVLLAVRCGAGFETTPWARSILADPHLGPGARLDRLEAAAARRL